tara:strand:- start:98 stop:439 length:342 start_codon:yes stop_codon:yes gene_type:complete
MAQTDEISLTEWQQYWLMHLRACDAAGTTTIEYARTHGINVKTLYSARMALAEKGTLPRPQPPRFHKAQVAQDPIRMDRQWHVQLPNGVVIASGGVVDARSLSVVLSTAANLS